MWNASRRVLTNRRAINWHLALEKFGCYRTSAIPHSEFKVFLRSFFSPKTNEVVSNNFFNNHSWKWYSRSMRKADCVWRIHSCPGVTFQMPCWVLPSSLRIAFLRAGVPADARNASGQLESRSDRKTVDPSWRRRRIPCRREEIMGVELLGWEVRKGAE